MKRKIICSVVILWLQSCRLEFKPFQSVSGSQLTTVLIQSVTRRELLAWVKSHQTQQPEDHIEDLCFGEEVLSKLDAGQCLQKGDGAAREREEGGENKHTTENPSNTGGGATQTGLSTAVFMWQVSAVGWTYPNTQHWVPTLLHCVSVRYA